MTTPHTSVQKRSSLVRAATQLLHEQGFQATTLAHVATRANVPVGNVYYYFRTKEALAEAVIAAHEAALLGLFATWETAHRHPPTRLHCLIRAPLDGSDSIIQFGCPHGSLCQELEKLGPDAPLAQAGARLLAVYLEWAGAQFQECGFRPAQARELARDLIASIQGTLLLAHTLHSHDLLARQLRRIEGWLDEQLPSPSRSRS